MNQPKALSVAQFCASYDVSKPLLYLMWRQGKGPRSYTVHRRRFISVEAAEQWQREMEQAALADREAA